ncbi:1124_t:CDS:1 [Scutellospora calospora]|uniref:1124_t:CDS:1 n=1 Tax=Scutellospora calospora TaxID=85575 RepID=A0ACA9JTQ2_9GLOM|nr:1124_t:CDS:1 [Scutellospora calospora]
MERIKQEIKLKIEVPYNSQHKFKHEIKHSNLLSNKSPKSQLQKLLSDNPIRKPRRKTTLKPHRSNFGSCTLLNSLETTQQNINLPQIVNDPKSDTSLQISAQKYKTLHPPMILLPTITNITNSHQYF